MNESEFRAVCDHLGHTYDVHKRYYRMHDTTVALAKVGRLLENDFANNEKRRTPRKQSKKLSSLLFVDCDKLDIRKLRKNMDIFPLKISNLFNFIFKMRI